MKWKAEKQKNYHSKNSGKSALVWNFFSSQKNEEKEEEEKVHKKIEEKSSTQRGAED